MYENQNKDNIKSLAVIIIIAIATAFLMGLFVRSTIVCKASETESILSTEETTEVSTPTDAVDNRPYLTNDTSPLPLQTNDYLLSIRNVLVAIWFTIVFIWVYEKLRTIIFRIGGLKK